LDNKEKTIKIRWIEAEAKAREGRSRAHESKGRQKWGAQDPPVALISELIVRIQSLSTLKLHAGFTAISSTVQFHTLRLTQPLPSSGAGCKGEKSGKIRSRSFPSMWSNPN
jgi:hypothetical protein